MFIIIKAINYQMFNALTIFKIEKNLKVMLKLHFPHECDTEFSSTLLLTVLYKAQFSEIQCNK